MSQRRWEAEWERLGRSDPFFGVCNAPEFQGRDLSGEAATAFWSSGERHVAAIAALVSSVTRAPFAPRRALDFGCGVGRLTAPLAQVAGEAVGVDISPAMLEQARARCAAIGLRNASFVTSDPALSRVDGTFDFVHSFIVFQHIPPAIGYRIFEEILGRLEPGGAGALHLTYHREAPLLRKLVHRLRRASRLVNMAVNVIQGAPAGASMMPMHEYDLARLLAALRRAGIHDVLMRHTDHGGHHGALLVFQKPRPAENSAA